MDEKTQPPLADVTNRQDEDIAEQGNNGDHDKMSERQQGQPRKRLHTEDDGDELVGSQR